MGPIMLDDPPEGFHPPKQKNPEVQIARRSYFGPFFFFCGKFLGDKKTNAAESRCFCFLSSFLLMKIECLTVF